MSQIEIIDSTLGKSDSSHFPILFNIARPHQDKLYLIPLFASNLASNTSKISTFPDHSIWNSSWHPSYAPALFCVTFIGTKIIL